MFSEYLHKAQQLMTLGQPFVVAVVVNYKPPISGKPGFRAIITEDGNLWGWIAGGCSQSIIVEEALQTLKTGSPKLIRITPDLEDKNDGTMNRKMTCHSGGTLEVYLEPVLAKPQIIIMGTSAVAQSLCKLAKALDYQVVAMGPQSDTLMAVADYKLIDYKSAPEISNPSFLVVSTQGEADELALEAALKMKPNYCAFVASKKKAAVVMDFLKTKGFSEDQIAAIKAPAGLNIKATRPEEIALSVLAEIVMTLRTGPEPLPAIEKPRQKAVDPICGMSVDIATAQHVTNYQGQEVYFCCMGCKMTFEAEPEKYLA